MLMSSRLRLRISSRSCSNACLASFSRSSSSPSTAVMMALSSFFSCLNFSVITSFSL